MTLEEAVAVAERIRNGERRIDEVTLNQAEHVLADAGDERESVVHGLKVWQYRNEECSAGLL
jgi:hypothetical protein